MLRRLLFTTLLCLTGWAGSSNAALLDVCNFQAGCGPDFGLSVTGDYVYDGTSNTGVLTLSAFGNTVSFLPGQLDSAYEAANGSTGLNITNSTAQGNRDFNMSFTVDGSGNLVAGANDISLNGRIFKGAPPFPVAISANGTVLDGDLISGGTIDEMAWAGAVLEFRGNIDSSSLLTTAGFGTGLSGILSMTMTDSNGAGLAAIDWNQSWTVSSGTLDVLVPVPAALWLFGSGLITLLGVARTKRSNA